MRRKLNVRLLLLLGASFAIIAVAVHYWHAHQLQRSAYSLLERADRAFEQKKYDIAQAYYAQYLGFVPNDVDTIQKYAESIDRRSDHDSDLVKLVLLMDQVLRAKPNEHGMRLRLVHNLIALDRVAEAIDHLQKLQSSGMDQAEIWHMLAWCHDAHKAYDQAIHALEQAIKINPKLFKSYRLLAEIHQERLNQPTEAINTMNAMVEANADSHEAYLMRARFQRRRGNADAAERDLRASLERKTDLPHAILEIAEIARAKGNLAEAERLLEDGVKRYPSEPGFYKQLADVKINAKHDGEAIRILEMGLKQAPNSNELNVLLIDLMIDQGKYAEAKARIDALVQGGLKPTLPNYLTARLRIADKQWSAAIALLELVRSDLGAGSEWNSRVQVLLGICYRQIGDRDQELQAFRRAVQAEPTWMAANVGLAEALLSHGRIEEASEVLVPMESAKDLPAGYWILLSRCRLYVQMRLPEADRQWTEFEQSLERAAKEAPKSVAVPIVRAEWLAARKDYAGAKSVLDATRAEHPDQAVIWCALAELACLQNRYDDAEKMLEQALQQHGLHDAIELRLAQARLWGARSRGDDWSKLARLGDLPATAYTAEQRIRLLRELSDLWYRLGAWDRARALWQELARALPKDLRSRYALMDLALQKDQAGEARTWRNEMRAIEGDQGWHGRVADAALLIHEAHGKRSQLGTARKQLQDLDLHHAKSPRVAFLLGTIDELEGKYQHAIEQYSRALDRGESQPRVLMRVLELLMQRREFGKAETVFAKYEQRWPITRDLARLGAEVALGMRGSPYAKLALKRAEQAVTLPTNDYRDSLWLAGICLAAGETARAETLLRDSLEKAGHAPDVWIAWMDFLAKTKQRDLAVRELERMKKEMPKARQALTVARCYEMLRLTDQAERAYQDAMRDRPDDFIVLSYAADFYRKTDRIDLARKCYERLVDPARPAPADFVISTRRHLAILLANSGEPAKALTLLDANRQTQGETIADARIRFFIQSQTDSARASSIAMFQDSLAVQVPSPDERVLFAQMLTAAGHFGQAKAQLAEAVHERPEAYYLTHYARLLIQLGENAEAKRIMDAVESDTNMKENAESNLRRSMIPEK